MAEICKMRKYVALLLLTLGICFSCTREPVAPSSEDGEVTSVVHYRATAGEGSFTKASLNGQDQYIFEAADKLYVTSGEDMYGVLHLVAGAGSTTATFEGDLMCLGGFTPEDSTPLYATLVSKPSDMIHTVEGGKLSETSYPDDAISDTFAQAVQRYSHFTASSTFSTHAFSLEQQSSFLLVTITFSDEEDVSDGDELTAMLKNGEETLVSGTVTAKEEDFYSHAVFVVTLPSSTTLEDAAISFKKDDTNVSTDEIANKTLEANRYYDIVRSHVSHDYFTIQAKEEGTTTVTFNHTGDGIQYKVNGSGDWADYDGSTISLDQKDFVQFRGNKNSYQGDNDGTKQLFSADKTCYIYGNLMSLCSNVSGTEYTPRTGIGADYAFRYAFKRATWVDIPAGRPLVLSATNLRKECYAQMFYGCTNLTHAPELPATSLSKAAYDHMFYGCTSLVAAPDLPAITVGEAAYCYMFYGCTSLVSVPAELKGTSGKQTCEYMFRNCTSLTTAPALPSTTVGQQGYHGMFQGCTSLVRAPELPATTIGSQGYQSMFEGCTSLTLGPPDLSATSLAKDCYSYMFKTDSLLVSGPESIAAGVIPENGCREMFLGCISLNRGPSMDRVTEIGNYGCQKMFDGCTALVSFSGLDNVETLGNYACNAMFYNCGELTTTPAELPRL